MKIGERIKQKRKEKKLSQKELASKTGIDNSQFSKIESGKLFPTLPQLVEICSILDESIDWIVLGIKKEEKKDNYVVELQKKYIDNLESEVIELKKEMASNTHYIKSSKSNK